MLLLGIWLSIMEGMRCPFPGMDPYLEHPALWPDVHNRLIAAMADDLAGQVAPRYYVGLERRAYLLQTDDLLFVGRPDISVIAPSPPLPRRVRPLADIAVMEVDLPMDEEVGENFLEVHEVKTGRLVTVVELLSPVNKLSGKGRMEYEKKRAEILRTRTNLVEIDLLRAGEPMPIVGSPVMSDYRILVSRGSQRPRGRLYAFAVRQAIPPFHLPLLPGDTEPLLDIGSVLHTLYERARFDLRLDYSVPPVPPLADEDEAWLVTVLQNNP